MSDFIIDRFPKITTDLVRTTPLPADSAAQTQTPTGPVPVSGTDPVTMSLPRTRGKEGTTTDPIPSITSLSAAIRSDPSALSAHQDMDVARMLDLLKDDEN